MKICVYGAASNLIDELYIKEVEKLGACLVRRGHELVFGAGAHGLMGAAVRGVMAAGGKSYGVIPRFFLEERIEEVYQDCTELFVTDSMASRKSKMEDLADAFLIVPGGIGTFEEFFQVLTLKQLGRHTKPIAVYNINGYYTEMMAMMENAIEKKFLQEECRKLYAYASDPDDLLAYLENDLQLQRDVHELKKG